VQGGSRLHWSREARMKERIQGKVTTGQCDGWNNMAKTSVVFYFFIFKSLFYFYWGVALCWKLKLRGVCMYVGFLCLCRCRAWSMTTRCKSRCGEVYACEANGWWCQVGCGRGGPGVVVSTIGAVGIRGGSVTYVVYIYISGRSRWVK
jgi:hypothetical protein